MSLPTHIHIREKLKSLQTRYKATTLYGHNTAENAESFC